MVVSVVAAAVYGYWSAPTSRPSDACGLQHPDRLVGSAVDRTRRTLEVRDLESRTVDPCVGRGTDRGDRLIERLEQAVGLVAHVAGIDAPAAGGRGGDSPQLLGVRMHARRVDQPG